MKLKYHQNKRIQLLLRTFERIPIGTKGPLTGAHLFEQKMLELILSNNSSLILAWFFGRKKISIHVQEKFDLTIFSNWNRESGVIWIIFVSCLELASKLTLDSGLSCLFFVISDFIFDS